MTASLYTVTLTDLGTYRITVAADTPAEAESIAKEVLCEEALTLPDGLSIVKRETEAVAETAPSPVQLYRVCATYKLDFSMNIPASSRDEAARHAKRLYAVNCGPFEFQHDGDRVTPFIAEEVVS